MNVWLCLNRFTYIVKPILILSASILFYILHVYTSQSLITTGRSASPLVHWIHYNYFGLNYNFTCWFKRMAVIVAGLDGMSAQLPVVTEYGREQEHVANRNRKLEESNVKAIHQNTKRALVTETVQVRLKSFEIVCPCAVHVRCMNILYVYLCRKLSM